MKKYCLFRKRLRNREKFILGRFLAMNLAWKEWRLNEGSRCSRENLSATLQPVQIWILSSIEHKKCKKKKKGWCHFSNLRTHVAWQLPRLIVSCSARVLDAVGRLGHPGQEDHPPADLPVLGGVVSGRGAGDPRGRFAEPLPVARPRWRVADVVRRWPRRQSFRLWEMLETVVNKEWQTQKS